VDQAAVAGEGNQGDWKMENFGVIEFNIEARGTFREILTLIYEIRNGDRITRITRMDVSAAGGGEGLRQINLTVLALSNSPTKK